MPASFDERAASALVGRVGTASVTVSPDGTAIAAGSGDLPVLATPRLVALLEEAACSALADVLPSGTTSVGTHIDVRHRAPSPLGVQVTATARITAVSGTRVSFEVSATHVLDGTVAEVGRGTHARAVVDREAFLGALESR